VCARACVYITYHLFSIANITKYETTTETISMATTTAVTWTAFSIGVGSVRATGVHDGQSCKSWLLINYTN